MLTIRENFDKALLFAMAETLENMAFMEVLESAATLWAPGAAEQIIVRVPVQEPVRGEIHLFMPKTLVRKIAGVIFPFPAEDLDHQALVDTAEELLNTFSGRFLIRLLQKGHPYLLGLPGPGEAEPSAAPGLRLRQFTAEGESFALGVSGEGLLALADPDAPANKESIFPFNHNRD